MDINTFQTIKTTKTVTITKDDCIKMIRKFYSLPVPQTAEICVKIPGGGDWSNTTLDIDGDSLIFIKWTEIEEK